MGEMDKSRELYSKEGDNSSQFEGKIVPWEHTIVFAHTDVTPLVGPPYWITASGLYQLLPCKLAMFSNQFINLQNGILLWDFDYFIETYFICIFNETKKNILWKPQKTISNEAVLTWERWINPESCTPEREITQADLKKKSEWCEARNGDFSRCFGAWWTTSDLQIFRQSSNLIKYPQSLTSSSLIQVHWCSYINFLISIN